MKPPLRARLACLSIAAACALLPSAVRAQQPPPDPVPNPDAAATPPTSDATATDPTPSTPSSPATPSTPSTPALTARVEADRAFSAASSRTVRDRDLLLRPHTSPEDILRVVPGLVIAQHQGGGKADQLFLRGFDADHGTDVSVNLDGIPVNMPSHAHGQGYTDLHFLIPEAIERVEIDKGPYFAEHGDFDTAGTVNLVTRKKFESSQATVQTGIFPSLEGRRRFSGYRGLGIASPEAGAFTSYFAAEVAGTDGPFIAREKLQRTNVFAKGAYNFSPDTQLSLLLTLYGSSWIGSGQIPARLVDAGVLDRYGSIDPTEGGATQRQQVIAAFTTRPTRHSSFTASVSALRYSLTLFNDFTFQAFNKDNGDEIAQTDQRTALFANLKYERTDRAGPALPLGTFTTALGVQFRNDDIAATLEKVQQRVRLATCAVEDGPAGPNPCVDTQTRQTDAAVYVQEDWKPVRWARLILGLRNDQFIYDVRSRKTGLDPTDPAAAAPPPTVQRSIQSPKASLVLSPTGFLDLYFNYGLGFHSNDARSVVTGGGDGALPRARGYEVGARTSLLDRRLDLAAAVWRLDLDSELVFNGDSGGTSPSDPTRRQGLDLEARVEFLPWLFADADLSLARSRFKADSGNGNAVALAPPRIFTAGLTARHPSGFSAALRVRHIGERPGNNFTAADGGGRCTPAIDADNPGGAANCYLIADGYVVLDATAGYRARHFSVTLTGENLANSAFREAQFGNVSQVVAPPVAGLNEPFTPEGHRVQDIHYTPGNPLNLQLATSVYF